MKMGETDNLHTLLCRAERQHMIAEKKNDLLMAVLRKEIKANAALSAGLQNFRTEMKE